MFSLKTCIGTVICNWCKLRAVTTLQHTKTMGNKRSPALEKGHCSHQFSDLLIYSNGMHRLGMFLLNIKMHLSTLTLLRSH